MASINQILTIPDWRKVLSFTNSTVPPPNYSQIYPGFDNYWYAQDSGGVIKRIAFDVQFGNGLESIQAPTESFVDFRVDVNVGAGLTFSYEGSGSEIYVTGLTAGNLKL